MHLKSEYAKSPNLQLPQNVLSAKVPIAMIESQLPWEPDLWVQVDAGFHLMGKPKHGKNFIVGTDPHCLDYSEARQWADLFLCMQTPYMKSGDEWLPYAYDPTCHFSDPTPVEKLCDAGFVGAPYDNRMALVKAIDAAGMTVLVTGYGPAYEEARQYYQKMRVGLNWSSLQDTTARVFEIMAMQMCLVTNRTPDLEKIGFVEGRDYLGFDDVDEAVRQVQYALSSDPPVRDRIALGGYNAVRPHTWDARVERILALAKG